MLPHHSWQDCSSNDGKAGGKQNNYVQNYKGEQLEFQEFILFQVGDANLGQVAGNLVAVDEIETKEGTPKPGSKVAPERGPPNKGLNEQIKIPQIIYFVFFQIQSL